MISMAAGGFEQSLLEGEKVGVGAAEGVIVVEVLECCVMDSQIVNSVLGR